MKMVSGFIALKRSEAEQEFHRLVSNINNLDFKHLDQTYKLIRDSLVSYHNDNKHLLRERKLYEYDLKMGIKIYEFFNLDKYGYSILSNYDFWRYICIKVVPDIICDRHGLTPEYYYKKNVRMYIPTLWWYIHMTWQGDLEKTLKVLKEHNTDTIQSLVERPGKNGVYLDTYRRIIHYYNLLDHKVKRTNDQNKNYLLRRIMVLHTAKCLLIDPDLVGVDDYVRMLFKNVGIMFNKNGVTYEYIR